MDPLITLVMVIDSLLEYIISSSDRKPASTAAVDALARIEDNRRALLDNLGQHPVVLHDVHAWRTVQAPKKES